jgi:hypothetical protein
MQLVACLKHPCQSHRHNVFLIQPLDELHTVPLRTHIAVRSPRILSALVTKALQSFSEMQRPWKRFSQKALQPNLLDPR